MKVSGKNGCQIRLTNCLFQIESVLLINQIVILFALVSPLQSLMEMSSSRMIERDPDVPHFEFGSKQAVSVTNSKQGQFFNFKVRKRGDLVCLQAGIIATNCRISITWSRIINHWMLFSIADGWFVVASRWTFGMATWLHDDGQHSMIEQKIFEWYCCQWLAYVRGLFWWQATLYYAQDGRDGWADYLCLSLSPHTIIVTIVFRRRQADTWQMAWTAKTSSLSSPFVVWHASLLHTRAGIVVGWITKLGWRVNDEKGKREEWLLTIIFWVLMLALMNGLGDIQLTVKESEYHSGLNWWRELGTSCDQKPPEKR